MTDFLKDLPVKPVMTDFYWNTKLKPGAKSVSENQNLDNLPIYSKPELVAIRGIAVAKKFTKDDAFQRIRQARSGSLAPDQLTEEYLIKLRSELYKFLERVNEKLLDLHEVKN